MNKHKLTYLDLFWQVMYVEGTAVVMGFEEPMLQTDDTPVKRCLQTKWPYIELLWTTDRSPSLNWMKRINNMLLSDAWMGIGELVFARKVVYFDCVKLYTGIIDEL